MVVVIALETMEIFYDDRGGDGDDEGSNAVTFNKLFLFLSTPIIHLHIFRHPCISLPLAADAWTFADRSAKLALKPLTLLFSLLTTKRSLSIIGSVT